MSKRIKEVSKESLTTNTSESAERSKPTKSIYRHSNQQNKNFCQFHFILFLIWLGVCFQQPQLFNLKENKQIQFDF
jgi:hypothetical protein